MAYNEILAGRIRKALYDIENVVEKKMFGGIAFMVNDKMCVGIEKDDLIIRCEPEKTGALLKKKGVRIFDITGRPMKGWLIVDNKAVNNKKDFDFWIALALDSNKKIKDARKGKG